jgi:hypothetical protein
VVDGVLAFLRAILISLAATDKESRMRREVINEIIRTEQDYIHDLEVVINVNPLPLISLSDSPLLLLLQRATHLRRLVRCQLFMTPLRMSSILTDADINTIFSNVQLLLGVNMYARVNLCACLTVNWFLNKIFATMCLCAGSSIKT